MAERSSYLATLNEWLPNSDNLPKEDEEYQRNKLFGNENFVLMAQVWRRGGIARHHEH